MVKNDIHSWKKDCYTPIWGTKSIGIEFLCFQLPEIDKKCTCECCPMKSDLTLAGLSLQCQVRSLKFKTTASVVIWPNLHLHGGKFESTTAYCFSIVIDYSDNAPCYPYRYQACSASTCPWEGMRQNAFAGRVGLTHATVNCLLWRHATTGTLVPGKSKGAPGKTTPRPDRAMLRMIRQDRFISARYLTARKRNLYGMRAGWKTINNRLLSHVYRAYRPTWKPLLIANHGRLCL